MTVKAILALADGGTGTEATLKTALLVAKAFAAHLDVLHVRADAETMVPIVGEGMSGAMVEQVMDAMVKSIETRSSAALAGYQRVCEPAVKELGGGSLAWREVTGREPEVTATAARLADLVVVGRPDSAEEAPMAATIDAALFDTGRPVMIAPPMAPSAIGKRIMVAWNGSSQSARVIAAALPFLAKAEQVVIAVGGGEDTQAPASGLVAYLERHSVRATVETFVSGHSIGKLILSKSAEVGADLLVMGAYGHSRLREMILGGATREVLAAATIPVLMAH